MEVGVEYIYKKVWLCGCRESCLGSIKWGIEVIRLRDSFVWFMDCNGDFKWCKKRWIMRDWCM